MLPGDQSAGSDNAFSNIVSSGAKNVYSGVTNFFGSGADKLKNLPVVQKLGENKFVNKATEKVKNALPDRISNIAEKKTGIKSGIFSNVQSKLFG